MNFKFLQGQTITFLNEKGQTETGKVEDVRTNSDGSQRITLSKPDEMIEFHTPVPIENILGKTSKILKDAAELIELIKEKRKEKDDKFISELSETTPFSNNELKSAKEDFRLSNNELKEYATSANRFGLGIVQYCLIINDFQKNIEKS